MKDYFSKYRIVNLVLLFITLGTYIVIENYVDFLCDNIICLYEVQYALVNPLSKGVMLLSILLSIFLFLPADIFRKWLWYLLPVGVFAAVFTASQISVYNSGILEFSRERIVELVMQAFSIVTVLFIGGQLLYRQLKKR